MIKTCRKTANVHHVVFFLTMNNGHLISNGTGTERSFWMWRRQKEEREKNNHYPKTCSVMSETLLSPAKSPSALIRKYSGFVIEMWMADRGRCYGFVQDCRSERRILTFMRERSHASSAYRPGTQVTAPVSLYLQARAQLWTEPVNTILCCPLLTSRLNQS